MTLYRVGWRYLLRHPWQTILMITGIMLGVAVAVAVDLANTSGSVFIFPNPEILEQGGKGKNQDN